MASPPTVLHLINASDAGGLTRYVIDVGRATQRRGWRVVVAGDRGAWHDRFADSGLEFVELPLMQGVRGFLRSVLLLRRWRMEHGPIDLIHTHYRRATKLARTLQYESQRLDIQTQLDDEPPDLLVGREVGPPSILYTLHLSHLNVSGWRRWLSDFGHHTHVASEDARQWMLKTVRARPERVTCIPHGIDTDRWPIATPADRAAARASLGLAGGDTVALFVGRLDEQKQPQWIVDAAESIAASNPRVRWLIVGDGPERAALEGRISNRASNIHVLGERDPLVPYHAADLLVSSSWREGFGYAPAEALSTGLPVLRTRTSGTHESIIEGVTGRSVPIDEGAFIDACRDMLGDPAALAAMRPACAAHARTHLRFDTQIDRTLALYGSIAKLCEPHGSGVTRQDGSTK